jgi:hypothetical protein
MPGGLFCLSPLRPSLVGKAPQMEQIAGISRFRVGALSAKTLVMSNALTALDKGKPRREPLMVAIAAVAIGMFIGTWIIGPSVSSGSMSKERSAEAPMSYKEMIARPDPFPYRTATPAFPQAPASDAAAVRERAPSEYSARMAESEPGDPWQNLRRRSSRSYMPDRHAIH